MTFSTDFPLASFICEALLLFSNSASVFAVSFSFCGVMLPKSLSSLQRNYQNSYGYTQSRALKSVWVCIVYSRDSHDVKHMRNRPTYPATLWWSLCLRLRDSKSVPWRPALCSIHLSLFPANYIVWECLCVLLVLVWAGFAHVSLHQCASNRLWSLWRHWILITALIWWAYPLCFCVLQKWSSEMDF